MPRKDPFITFEVDLSRYANVERKVKKLYPKPSTEMLMLVVNFWYYRTMAVRLTRPYYTGKPVSHTKLSRALDALQQDGYIQVDRPGWISQAGGRATTFKTTDRFDKTFSFRNMPQRIFVTQAALTREGSMVDEDDSEERIPIAQVPGAYSALVSSVKLSLSNRGQVFQDEYLNRINGRRLYQRGIHNYQQIPSEERPNLLIDGRPTVELDYVSLHPCMLLNLGGKDCPKRDVYSSIVSELGIQNSNNRRSAVKHAFLIATSFPTVKGFPSFLGREEPYQQHLKTQKITPKMIYNAIITVYPELTQYICTGKEHGRNLQKKDSEIMIDILEILATKGIVSLPVHDSVICPKEHTAVVEQVMRDVYKQHMGFDIQVEAK